MASTNQSSVIVDIESSASKEIVVYKKEEMETKGSVSKSEEEMKEVTESLAKVTLNPLAPEFYPSSHRGAQRVMNDTDGYSNHTLGRRRLNRRTTRVQLEDTIRRTVYVSEVDRTVSEEDLASVFMGRCGNVIDCRICGDPHSLLRFAFVEFADEQAAKEALELSGVIVGLNAIRVSPSKTAIVPVNPVFLPRSDYEMEMVTRTIYCTNIDRLIPHDEVKQFFEMYCGKVTRLRLLEDDVQATRIAFVEFASTVGAVSALTCNGMLVGNFTIRVSPSKTPVRPRSRHAHE